MRSKLPLQGEGGGAVQKSVRTSETIASAINTAEVRACSRIRVFYKHANLLVTNASFSVHNSTSLRAQLHQLLH